MKYNNLGNSGLKVSQLCLGAMTFGSGFRNVGSVSQQDANEMVKYAIENGINFFDTADVYSWGDSEKVLGNAIKAANVARENIIIATKVRGKMSDDINDVGLSRHHILNSIEKSLKRLQVDYIDQYQVHGWDPTTPLGETMAALNDLVRWGKVRYIGVSNFAAWQLSKANFIAKKHGWSRFISFQGYYSLIGRGIENEIVPLCSDQKMGLMTWSPLAGGLLSGKYRKDKPIPKGTRLNGELKTFIPMNVDKLYEILEVLDEIAEAHKVPVASVALAWLKYKNAVSTIIIGARTMKHLEENIIAGELDLDLTDIEKLDETSASEIPYPQWMIARQTGMDKTVIKAQEKKN
jgi:aryl-alcohol dehydrogenase-like predicted oxidoreductase